jgi:hypothetical protein
MVDRGMRCLTDSTENSLAFKDQSLTDLSYTLLRQIPDLGDFTVLKSARVECGMMKIGLHILGESHLITLENPVQDLSEVVSCNPAQLSHYDYEVRCDASQTLTSQRQRCFVSGEELLEYQFKAETQHINCQAALLRKLTDAGLPRGIRLEYQFPSHASIFKENQYSPKTILDCLLAAIPDPAKGGQSLKILLRTLHIYPAESRFLVTNSRWVWRNAGRTTSYIAE